MPSPARFAANSPRIAGSTPRPCRPSPPVVGGSTGRPVVRRVGRVDRVDIGGVTSRPRFNRAGNAGSCHYRELLEGGEGAECM